MNSNNIPEPPHAQYGLLGEKLTHSRSPQIHRLLGNEDYALFPTEPDQVEPFLTARNFLGLNVTIPYKETVIPFCARLSDAAARMKSVNTLIVEKDGSLTGDNTDYYGFCYLLNSLSLSLKGKKALVLGSGGSSKTVCCALHDYGCSEVVVISRSGENNYSNLDAHKDCFLLVNTTPVGMYPKNGAAPVSLTSFPCLKGVIDLIYNPLKTRLLLEAEQMGIPCRNGLLMLVAQAKRASELFFHTTRPDHCITDIYEKMSAEMTNIVLIGMPGCGKSSVGQILHKRLGRPLLDTDEMIKEMTGHTPSDLILREGEPYFRMQEKEAVAMAGKQNGVIIATGGGVVTIPENLNFLKQNGYLVFINRCLESLPINGRPLSSANGGVAELYRQRLPLYRAFCDVEIPAGSSAEGTVENALLYVCKVLKCPQE